MSLDPYLVLTINMMVAAISPPVGYNVFCVRAIIPKDVTMADIYRSTIPFLLIHILVILLVMFFPAIALWLPDHLIRVILW